MLDVKGCSSEMDLLTVVIPVYNEESTIGELLRRVVSSPYPGKQIIVIDDGSTDGTAAVLEEWRRCASITVLAHGQNRGKGRAMRTALVHARGRFILVQDADLEYDPGEYATLLEPLRSGLADVVYGSRYLGDIRNPPGQLVFRLGVVVLNFVSRVLYGVRLTDEAAGFKVVPAEIMRRMNLQCERFEFCPEVTAKACRLGLRIVEVPVTYRPRSFETGKKIRLSDGLAAIMTLWRWRNWSGDILPARALT
jgi:dolichol-phosphate mannosyltransferase